MPDYKETFAYNLKKLRKEAGLTQENLGQMLLYSEKSVSKWENGLSVPPADVLLKLSEILGVGLDELFDRPSSELYYLGVDGGGTKTAFCLIDKNKKIVKRYLCGPSNPFDIGIENTIACLEDGIKNVTAGISLKNISIYAGIAGSRSGNFAHQIDSFLENCHFHSYKSGSDIDITVDAAMGKGNGIAVIMGTGQCIIPKIDGKISIIGGLGYLFDMGGSGYDLGAQAIRSAIMEEEGSGESTLMRELILKKTGENTVREHLLKFYEAGKTGIASFAPVVFEAYSEGDSVAKEIMKSNMHHIAELIIGASKRFNETSPIKTVICGGLRRFEQIIIPVLNDELENAGYKNKISLSVFSGDMAYHAAEMAIELQKGTL